VGSRGVGIGAQRVLLTPFGMVEPEFVRDVGQLKPEIDAHGVLMRELDQAAIVVGIVAVAVPAGGMDGAHAVLAPHLDQILDADLLARARIKKNLDHLAAEQGLEVELVTHHFQQEGVTAITAFAFRIEMCPPVEVAAFAILAADHGRTAGGGIGSVGDVIEFGLEIGQRIGAGPLDGHGGVIFVDDRLQHPPALLRHDPHRGAEFRRAFEDDIGAVLDTAHQQKDLLLFEGKARRGGNDDEIAPLRHDKKLCHIQPNTIDPHAAQGLLPVLLAAQELLRGIAIVQQHHPCGMLIGHSQRFGRTGIFIQPGHAIDHTAHQVCQGAFGPGWNRCSHINPPLRHRHRFAQSITAQFIGIVFVLDGSTLIDEKFAQPGGGEGQLDLASAGHHPEILASHLLAGMAGIGEAVAHRFHPCDDLFQHRDITEGMKEETGDAVAQGEIIARCFEQRT